MKIDHLKNSLIRICAQPRTLGYITSRMGGLDPVKISKLLIELREEGKLFEKEDYWSVVSKEISLFSEDLNKDAELPIKKYMGHFNFLKTPHPLDFEWRNTLKSLNFLADLIGQVNEVNDKVLILGMPTLFATCSSRSVTQKVTLLERNKPIVKALHSNFVTNQYRIQEKDIFEANPDSVGKYYSVFMDPPWYSNFLYQFVWLGARCLEPGGLMVISIPPINTRSDVDEERIKWFTFCQKQGLCIERLEPEKLEYAMPFFEYNAFRTAGTTNVQPFWRKGDLAFFRKVSESKEERPRLDIPNQNWREKELDGVRIRVVLEGDESEDQEIKIESLVKTDILPGVSRSDEIRKQANVWTSGNRIFRVNKPKKFWKALNDSGTDEYVDQWKEMILKLEIAEYKDYLSHIYYEMERQTT